MKRVMISILAISLCHSLYGVQHKNTGLGKRFRINLQESPGYKWSDPVVNPVGVVRIEGPRKIVQSPKRPGSGKIVFTFYALKAGNASISFRQMKGMAPVKIHEVSVTVK
jgi:hypothetical protein